MKSTWRTVWQGQDIVVYRNDAEVDRLHAPDIERVVLVHRGSGHSPGDVLHTVVELGASCRVLGASTGFAGRVNFEREAYWAERDCVYWVHVTRAPMPSHHWRLRWWPALARPAHVRVPRDEWGALLERWPLQGPQTWNQRKWRRIERSRPFAPDWAPGPKHDAPRLS